MSLFLQIVESPVWIQWAALLLTFVATFILALFLYPDQKAALLKLRLGVVEESSNKQVTSLLKWFRPMYSIVTPFLYSNIFPNIWLQKLDEMKHGVKKNLRLSNLIDEITADEFIGFKFVTAALIPFVLYNLLQALNFEVSIGLIIPLIVLGFYYPDIWLSQKITSRKKAIVRALPYTIDLLTLSVEAGLDFVSAIRRLTQQSKTNALIQELGIMLQEIRFGATRSDALRNLSTRLEIEEVSSLASLLIQADQLGASIGQVLRAQSEQIRTRRFQKAEIEGAKASQVILFPLVFCILPAAMLILLGPTFLSFIQGGLF